MVYTTTAESALTPRARYDRIVTQLAGSRPCGNGRVARCHKCGLWTLYVDHDENSVYLDCQNGCDYSLDDFPDPAEVGSAPAVDKPAAKADKPARPAKRRRGPSEAARRQREKVAADLSARFLNGPALPAEYKHVLLALAWRVNSKRQATVSYRAICKAARLGNKSLTNVIAGLEGAGFITKTATRRRGYRWQRGANRYRFMPLRQWAELP